MRIENLGTFEREQVLRLLLNHMDQKTRGILIRTLPMSYRKMLDKEVTPEFASAIRSAVID